MTEHEKVCQGTNGFLMLVEYVGTEKTVRSRSGHPHRRQQAPQARPLRRGLCLHRVSLCFVFGVDTVGSLILGYDVVFNSLTLSLYILFSLSLSLL